jgi:methionyl aminopeptidase
MSEKELQILLDLGKFTKNLREEAEEIVVEGKTALEIIEFIEDKIFEKGYLPAFPATICINHQAAHFTPFEEEIALKKGDVVKIDFGVSKNGIITDNAFTKEILTENFSKLLKENKDALYEELDKIDVGVKVSEVGKIPFDKAKSCGFDTIHNLSGHQIDINNLHCGITIPNYDNKDNTEIKDNIVLAIEPFFTTKSPIVKAEGKSNILHLKEAKPVRDIIAKKVLDYIKDNFPHLPFSKRWLLKKFEKRKILYALNILKKNNILFEYDILVAEDKDSIISQFEHTVAIVNGKKYIVTD